MHIILLLHSVWSHVCFIGVLIVHPSWVLECISSRKLIPYTGFILPTHGYCIKPYYFFQTAREPVSWGEAETPLTTGVLSRTLFQSLRMMDGAGNGSGNSVWMKMMCLGGAHVCSGAISNNNTNTHSSPSNSSPSSSHGLTMSTFLDYLNHCIELHESPSSYNTFHYLPSVPEYLVIDLFIYETVRNNRLSDCNYTTPGTNYPRSHTLTPEELVFEIVERILLIQSWMHPIISVPTKIVTIDWIAYCLGIGMYINVFDICIFVYVFMLLSIKC